MITRSEFPKNFDGMVATLAALASLISAAVNPSPTGDRRLIINLMQLLNLLWRRPI